MNSNAKSLTVTRKMNIDPLLLSELDMYQEIFKNLSSSNRFNPHYRGYLLRLLRKKYVETNESDPVGNPQEKTSLDEPASSVPKLEDIFQLGEGQSKNAANGLVPMDTTSGWFPIDANNIKASTNSF